MQYYNKGKIYNDVDFYELQELRQIVNNYNCTIIELYDNGLRASTFNEEEYKNLPIEWIIELFKK